MTTDEKLLKAIVMIASNDLARDEGERVPFESEEFWSLLEGDGDDEVTDEDGPKLILEMSVYHPGSGTWAEEFEVSDDELRLIPEWIRTAVASALAWDGTPAKHTLLALADAIEQLYD